MSFGKKSYMKLPYAEGYFYPATDMLKKTFSQKIARLGKLLKKEKLYFSTCICCGNDAANFMFKYQEIEYVFIKASEFDEASDSKVIKHPIFVSYNGEGEVVLKHLNSSGFSCVWDNSYDNPIVILPDFFDPFEYKNFKGE